LELRDMNLEVEGPIIFLDPAITLIASYVYLFYHLIGDRLRPPA
jgi:hypothetical protein